MLYRVPAAASPARVLRHGKSVCSVLILAAQFVCAPQPVRAQNFAREVDAPGKLELRVKNRTGRVTVVAADAQKNVSINATSAAGLPVGERDVRVESGAGGVSIEVEREGAGRAPAGGRKVTLSPAQVERERIDVTVRVPTRTRVFVETEAGAVDVLGNVSDATVKTDTGTIRADVPLDALRYSFRWTLSRPRFFSEVELPKVKSKRGGEYEIAGRFGDKEANEETRVRLDLETARGVVLFGVKDEAEVPADLRERPLTEAARAIIRSGDAELIDTVRKVAPRLVGEYAETLPQHTGSPSFSSRANPFDVKTSAGASLARVQARVTDHNGRAISDLTARDFTVVEDGLERPVRDVQPTSAPFNLILLLDVSGSVEERIDFIRKAALSFLNTAGPQDRIAIISFRDDVQLVSDFTSDRHVLTERIKDIQAGGATALYDALGYSLVDTLKPLRGERTGIVILSDGDDNRSFLSFPSILDTVYETGAIIYPLYLPSGLIPAGSAAAAETTLDPTRSRFLELTSRADAEGRKLAEVSGGTYYHITRLEQLQRAYDDVAAQLRTAYTITYEAGAGSRRDSRVHVRVARDGASVRLSPAVGVAQATTNPTAAP
ncbi:MAG TPA: VWA domain-containing protein [Pyrinomonadaceae bacterium]|jgi:Ca-activated chloride channel family protein|nr:VWA domain-containing protein [Pyrinomonadaceae bacterium]